VFDATVAPVERGAVFKKKIDLVKKNDYNFDITI
jgi:hypothetical protein